MIPNYIHFIGGFAAGCVFSGAVFTYIVNKLMKDEKIVNATYTRIKKPTKDEIIIVQIPGLPPKYLKKFKDTWKEAMKKKHTEVIFVNKKLEILKVNKKTKLKTNGKNIQEKGTAKERQ